jgi:hypothetical protein
MEALSTFDPKELMMPEQKLLETGKASSDEDR